MDCRVFREKLDTCFPSLYLSDEAKLHLEGCISCRQYLLQMRTMAETLGKEEDFYLGELAIERLVASVNSRIDDSLPKESVNSFKLGRLIPVAAAVVLIVSVGLISLFVSDDSNDGGVSGTLKGDSSYTLLDDPYNMELDENTIKLLFDDFTSEFSTYADELLLGDLTDEEFNYLMNNYDVGELL